MVNAYVTEKKFLVVDRTYRYVSTNFGPVINFISTTPQF